MVLGSTVRPLCSQISDHWLAIYFQLMRTMNAFVNSRGGRMYFGIDDSGLVKCAAPHITPQLPLQPAATAHC